MFLCSEATRLDVACPVSCLFFFFIPPSKASAKVLSPQPFDVVSRAFLLHRFESFKVVCINVTLISSPTEFFPNQYVSCSLHTFERFFPPVHNSIHSRGMLSISIIRKLFFLFFCPAKFMFVTVFDPVAPDEDERESKGTRQKLLFAFFVFSGRHTIYLVNHRLTMHAMPSPSNAPTAFCLSFVVDVVDGFRFCP